MPLKPSSSQKASTPRDFETEAAVELYRRRQARTSLPGFARYVLPTFTSKPFHLAVAEALKRFSDGKVKRLMITAPPQHGKSLQSSILLPAWHYGQRPTDKVILASYGADKALDFGRDVRNLMASPEFGVIFPGVGLAQDSAAAERFNVNFRDADGRTRQGGSFFAVGAGGSITGRGADRIIVDDLIKGPEQAYSEGARRKIWDWFNTVLMTRLSGDAGAVLILNTRWHEDDLSGRLIREAQKGGEAWEVLNLPALAEAGDPLGRKEGEALWPERYSEAYLAEAKRRSPSRFAALYQQRPTADEGGIIKRAWLAQFYKTRPDTTGMEVVSSWDLAFDGGANSDFVSGKVWGKKGGKFYLLPEQVHARLDFPETVKAFIRLNADTPDAKRKLVEKKANGAALISTLKAKVPGIIPVEPKGDKVARAMAVSYLFEAGNVVLPDPDVWPWVRDFIEELVSFPNAAHDDDVDTTTQALSYLNTTSGWIALMREEKDALAPQT